MFSVSPPFPLKQDASEAEVNIDEVRATIAEKHARDDLELIDMVRLCQHTFCLFFLSFPSSSSLLPSHRVLQERDCPTPRYVCRAWFKVSGREPAAFVQLCYALVVHLWNSTLCFVAPSAHFPPTRFPSQLGGGQRPRVWVRPWLTVEHIALHKPTRLYLFL